MVDANAREIIDKTATQLGVEKVPVSWKELVAVQEEIIRPDVLRSGIFCQFWSSTRRGASLTRSLSLGTCSRW